MEKKSVRKYCHVNAYLAYDMDINDQNLIYKKSFKFLLGAGTNDQNGLNIITTRPGSGFPLVHQSGEAVKQVARIMWPG